MLTSYFKNSSIILATQAILQIKNLIFIPYLTRHFGTLNYGIWAQISIFIPLLAPVIILSTQGAAVRYLSGESYTKQSSWYTAWMIFLLGSWLIIISIFLLFSKQAAAFIFGDDVAFQSYMPLVAGNILISILLNSQRTWFRIQNSGIVFSIMNIAEMLLSVVVLLIVLSNNLSVYEYVLYTIYANGLLFVLLAIYQTGKKVFSKPDLHIIPKLIRFGLPTVPIGYADWGLHSMDRLFLVHITSLSQIGIYSLAYSIGQLIIPTLVRPFKTMYPPMATSLYNNGKLDKLQSLFNHAAGTGLALALPAATGLIVLGRQFLAIVATDDFLNGAPVLGIVAFGYIFYIMSTFISVHLGLVHRQILTTVATVLAVSINLVLNIALIPHFGIFGAAAATTIAFFAQLLATLFFSNKHNVVRINILFIIKVLVACGIMGIVVHISKHIISYFLDQPVVLLLLQILTGIITYFCILLTFKIIGKRQFQAVRFMFAGNQA